MLGGLSGGGELGDGKAPMLTNQVPTGGTTSLFTTSARMDAAPLIEGRVGVRLGRNVWVEGGGSYARPDFAVDIAADIEGAPDVTAISTLTQVTVDGSLQYRWTDRPAACAVRDGRRGYLRQLDETRATAETGWMAQGGGGVLVRLSTRARLPASPRLPWRRACPLAPGRHHPDRAAPCHLQASAGMTLHLGGGF